MTKTIKAFNVNTMEVEKATIVVDKNNEFLITFSDQSFIKIPGTFTIKEIVEYLDKYKECNEGQVKQEDVDAIKNKLEGELDGLEDDED